MCLAIPGRVVKTGKGFAVVDYSGEKRKASAELVKVKPGDYVLVQAKFIVQQVPEQEALEAIKLWESQARAKTKRAR